MQVKVLDAERRRRWSDAEKLRLVEESLQAGQTVSGVARRHKVAPSLLFTWRRQARRGHSSIEATPALVPVEIALASAPVSPCGQQIGPLPAADRSRTGIIEIELSGCRVRVDRDVDAEALRRVLEVLRRR
jgi:transposase